MTGNTVHDAFLKMGHKQYVLHVSIFAFKKRKKKGTYVIYTHREKVEKSIPKC